MTDSHDCKQHAVLAVGLDAPDGMEAHVCARCEALLVYDLQAEEWRDDLRQEVEL